MESSTFINWHRLFGLTLTDFFTDSEFSVELEVESQNLQKMPYGNYSVAKRINLFMVTNTTSGIMINNKVCLIACTNYIKWRKLVCLTLGTILKEITSKTICIY